MVRMQRVSAFRPMAGSAWLRTGAPQRAHWRFPGRQAICAFASRRSDDRNGSEVCGDRGCWAAFSTSWNETLARRPMPMVIFFSATSTLTWALIYGALSASSTAGSLLAAPELAVGWLVMRVTYKLRAPLNLAAAAAVSGACPALSKLKVSPLLATFAADGDTQAAVQKARQRLEESPHLGPHARMLLKRSFLALASFVRWLEGPIDKYGLSYFLVAKASSLATVGAATAAAMHGLDVPAALAAWGLSDELQSGAGLLAGAAALNAPCVPLHFCGAVAAVRGLEGLAARAWLEHRRALRSALRAAGKGQGGLTEEERRSLRVTAPEAQRNFVANASYLVLLLDLGFSLWLLRRLSQGRAGPAPEPREELPGDGQAPELGDAAGAGEGGA
mmetsp:Transcript_107746/g.347853  ORF Transcript_107746/g.347853 Transcript_107746/m.347853 type:complete len:389 (+) Transcript_107746:56-1222(+)